MLVGERHHEAIERLALQLIAKPSESGGISGHSGSSNWCWQASQVDQVDALVGCLFTTPTKGRSEEHTSELQSLMRISYAVFCLKKTKCKHQTQSHSYYKRTQLHEYT